MKLGIIGTGYVGLVTGASFALLGHEVICVDKDEQKIAQLKQGQVPIYEPGLTELIAQFQGKNLHFTAELAEAVAASEILFICVGTPTKGDGEADLTFVEAVARELGQCISGRKLIVTKSTVPVGSAQWVATLIQRERAQRPARGRGRCSYEMVSNPEFLRQGSAVQDFLFPDRIVIGADSEAARAKMQELYRPILEQSFDYEPRRVCAPTLIGTSTIDAEMIKYAANSFLATKISFINEIANICELVGADVREVAAGMGLDRRIGPNFLNAGLGFGGSCFPKDIAALIKLAKEYYYEPELLQSVCSVNSRQLGRLIKKLQRQLKVLKGRTVAVFGVAFKPNTDDLRNAPALELIRYLLNSGALVKAFDPVAQAKAHQLLPEVEFCKTPYEAAREADALVICTEWPEVQTLNFKRLARAMRQRLIIDGRNCIEPGAVRALGFTYDGIGIRPEAVTPLRKRPTRATTASAGRKVKLRSVG